MEIKRFSALVEPKPSSEGKFKALVAVFGVVDRGGDVVHRGAFSASLARWRASNRKLAVLYNHGSDPEDIIGSVSPFDSQETERGLVVSGTLNMGEARARKVFEELKRGTLAEWSFGCVIEEARPRANGGRDLITVDLFEVSPTLLAKGIGTETLMIASATPIAPQQNESGPLVLPAALTAAQRLAPYQERLNVVARRVARSREQ